MSIISIRILCFLGCSLEKVGREGSFCISAFWHGNDGGGDDGGCNDGDGDDGDDGDDYADAFPQKYTRLLI